MNFKLIIVGIILLLGIYILYKVLFRDKGRTHLIKSHVGKKTETINADSLSNGLDSDFSVSFWMYINGWNYRNGEAKDVLIKGNNNVNSLRLQLGENINNLTATVATTAGPTACAISNVPLQRWVNIIVVLNNRALDLYLDGKIVRTCMLGGVLKGEPNEKLTLTPGGGFDGNLSNLVYYSRPINPRKAYSIYRDGPGTGYGLGMLNRYKLKIAFLENEREVSSVKI